MVSDILLTCRSRRRKDICFGVVDRTCAPIVHKGGQRIVEVALFVEFLDFFQPRIVQIEKCERFINLSYDLSMRGCGFEIYVSDRLFGENFFAAAESRDECNCD